MSDQRLEQLSTPPALEEAWAELEHALVGCDYDGVHQPDCVYFNDADGYLRDGAKKRLEQAAAEEARRELTERAEQAEAEVARLTGRVSDVEARLREFARYAEEYDERVYPADRDGQTIGIPLGALRRARAAMTSQHTEGSRTA